MKLKFQGICLILFFLLGYNQMKAQKAVWTAPESANELKNPLAGNQAATLQGKKTFNQMCYLCHGMKGKGDGMAGAALDPKPANFLSLRVKNESDGAIFWKITHGNPPMMSYKDALTDDQRWQLVNYIRVLEKQE